MEIRLTERTPGSPYQSAPSDWYLTDQHPRSSYGMLVLCNDTDGQGYGPADIVMRPTQEMTETIGNHLARPLTAGEIVVRWATENITSPGETYKIRLYLSQWPDGPQLPDSEQLANDQEWHTTNRRSGDIDSAYDH